MEMEYRDPSKRGRWIIVLGLVLAIGAGASAFYLVNNAQQKAGQGEIKTMTGVVVTHDLPARSVITDADIAVRTDIPLDATNGIAYVVSDKNAVLGKTLGVPVVVGQLLTLNLFVSVSTAGGQQFSILGPDETVGPDSEAWRAVSITVPDDRAVGGVLAPGATVDVIMTVNVSVPSTPAPPAAGPSTTPWSYITDASTKVTYQDMRILARTGTFYVLKATLRVAEEISHVQAAGGAQFSLVLRPDNDTRILDVSALGATTNRIIQRYGLLIPQSYPADGRFPSQPPIAPITPAPSPTATAAPSGAPAATPAPTPAPTPAASG
jgi:Flp pilus assembly protein CpaB